MKLSLMILRFIDAIAEIFCMAIYNSYLAGPVADFLDTCIIASINVNRALSPVLCMCYVTKCDVKAINFVKC